MATLDADDLAAIRDLIVAETEKRRPLWTISLADTEDRAVVWPFSTSASTLSGTLTYENLNGDAVVTPLTGGINFLYTANGNRIYIWNYLQQDKPDSPGWAVLSLTEGENKLTIPILYVDESTAATATKQDEILAAVANKQPRIV